MTATILEKDHWYEQHPDKLLATPVSKKGRFGMVTNYEGSVSEALNHIKESLSIGAAPMAHMEKKYKLSFGEGAGVIRVWNSLESIDGDHPLIAHISLQGDIQYLVPVDELPTQEIEKIEDYAAKIKAELQKKYALSDMGLQMGREAFAKGIAFAMDDEAFTNAVDIDPSSKQYLLEYWDMGLREARNESKYKENPVNFLIGNLSFPNTFKMLPTNQKQYFVKFNKENRNNLEELKGQFKAISEVENILSQIPQPYAQDDLDIDEKLVYAHYFIGNSDWYVTEWNREDMEFFGYVILNGDTEMAELGYFSFAELNTLNEFPNLIQLDLHFPVQKLGKIREQKGIIPPQEKASKVTNVYLERLVTIEKTPSVPPAVMVDKSQPNHVTTIHVTAPTAFDFVKSISLEDEVAPKGYIPASVLDNIIKTSEAHITKKLNKSKAIEADHFIEMYSYEDIHTMFNQNISQEEFRVFVWWKSNQGQRLSQPWYDIADKDQTVKVDDISENTSTFKSWMETGMIFWNGEGFEPRPLYQSGNVWEKIDLLRSRDNAYIIAKFGQKVYEQHLSALQSLYDDVYKNRAILDDNDEDARLFIKPMSEFAESLYITDEQNLDKEGNFEKVKLVTAFKSWLFANKYSIDLKKNITVYEIIDVYFNKQRRPKAPSGKSEDLWALEYEKLKEDCEAEGIRLFNDYIRNEISTADKLAIEKIWNKRFNAIVLLNTKKIPVLFSIGKYFKGNPLNIYEYQREGCAFNFIEDTSCLAFDVGYGKTITSIISLAQAMQSGYCKRPLICVPNQVYKQFMNEIRALLPQYAINDFYNFGAGYKPNVEVIKQMGGVAEDSISIITYEGADHIGLDVDKSNDFLETFVDIVEQKLLEGASLNRVQKHSVLNKEKALSFLAKGNKGSTLMMEDFGWDYLLMDEAHNAKKIFTVVKGAAKAIDDKGRVQRGTNEYDITSGTPSNIGIKCFMMAFYIQSRNNFRNTQLLTATPFTNSPLEIYSMLSLIGYKKLKANGLNNIKEFFDNFIKVESKYVINAQLRPQYRQVVTGFNQLPALQKIMLQFFLHKNVVPKNLIRPDMVVIPMTASKDKNDNYVELPTQDHVLSYLKMTDLQEQIMNRIKEYCNGNITYDDLCNNIHDGAQVISSDDDEDEPSDENALEVTDEMATTASEKVSIRILRSISAAVSVSFSPYLFKCYQKNIDEITPKELVASSAKLSYVMGCIKSVRQHHLSLGQPVSGQIIFSNVGVSYFPLLKQYLVEEIGYKEHEVAIIVSGLPKSGKKSKEYLKNLFNGEKYNEATREFEPVPDSERIKVVIGSNTIIEGINLQKYTSVGYDCSIDWNPTVTRQKQGRFHRQGNTFKSIRYVFPLTENSMDIFYFQKQEEKARRINELWDTDGKNKVFKIDEFDPEEAKYTMITDPRVLAELEINKLRVKAQESLLEIEGKYNRIENIKFQYAFMKKTPPLLHAHLKSYAAQFGETIPDDMTLAEMIAMHKYCYRYNSTRDNMQKPPIERKSIVMKFFIGLENLIDFPKILKRDEEFFLKARGITFDDLDALKPVLAEEVTEKKAYLDKLESEVFFNTILQEQSLKIATKDVGNESSVENRVAQFASLNYLLDQNVSYEVAMAAPALMATSQSLSLDEELESFNASLRGLEIELEYEEDPQAIEDLQSAIMGMKFLIEDLKEQIAEAPTKALSFTKSDFDLGETKVITITKPADIKRAKEAEADNHHQLVREIGKGYTDDPDYHSIVDQMSAINNDLEATQDDLDQFSVLSTLFSKKFTLGFAPDSDPEPEHEQETKLESTSGPQVEPEPERKSEPDQNEIIDKGSKQDSPLPLHLDNAIINNWNALPEEYRIVAKLPKKQSFEYEPSDKVLTRIFDPIVSDDAIRPQLTGIHFGDRITGTNGHILLSIKNQGTHKEGKIYGYTESAKKHGHAINGVINETYVNFDHVTPPIRSSYKINILKFTTYLSAVEKGEYCNPVAKQIVMKVADEKVGFNLRLWNTLLGAYCKITGKEDFYLGFHHKERGFVICQNPIADNYKEIEDLIGLIMPVHLLEHAPLGTQDVDMNYKLNVYFDADRNEIINSDGSVANFDSNLHEPGDYNPLSPTEYKVIGKYLKNAVVPIFNYVKIEDGILSFTNHTTMVTKQVRNDIPQGMYLPINGALRLQDDMDISDFPLLYTENINEFSSIPKEIMVERLSQAVPHTHEKDGSRRRMEGVNFKTEKNLLIMQTTDGLSAYRSVIMPTDKNIDLILDDAEFVLDLLKGAIGESINMSVQSTDKIVQQRLVLETTEMSIYTKTINEGFPDVLNAMPDTYNKQFTIADCDLEAVLSEKKAKDSRYAMVIDVQKLEQVAIYEKKSGNRFYEYFKSIPIQINMFAEENIDIKQEGILIRPITIESIQEDSDKFAYDFEILKRIKKSLFPKCEQQGIKFYTNLPHQPTKFDI